jgi:hypothetical protein
MAQIAINGRDATSTGVAPFFLQHGYNVDPIRLKTSSEDGNNEAAREGNTDKEKAERVVTKLREVFELAQARMAEAQQEQEKQANRSRREAQQYRVGDKVWLRLDKQYSTGRQSKKLDWKNAKYTVIEVIDSHSVKLNTPPGTHPVFHVDRLRLASTDPLPSQSQDDSQPLPLQVDGEDEWVVEEIVAEDRRRRGRGWRLLYEVKWKGFHLTTPEPADLLLETEALTRWENYSRPHRNEEGQLPTGFRRSPP